MDKIFLNDLKLETIIGVYPWERKTKQILLMDLEFAIDAYQIAQSDSLKDALDYAKIVEAIISYTQNNHFNLIESLAQKLAEFLFAEFSMERLKLQIRKRGVMASIKEVGVVIERSKSD